MGGTRTVYTAKPSIAAMPASDVLCWRVTIALGLLGGRVLLIDRLDPSRSYVPRVDMRNMCGKHRALYFWSHLVFFKYELFHYNTFLDIVIGRTVCFRSNGLPRNRRRSNSPRMVGQTKASISIEWVRHVTRLIHSFIHCADCRETT